MSPGRFSALSWLGVAICVSEARFHDAPNHRQLHSSGRAVGKKKVRPTLAEAFTEVSFTVGPPKNASEPDFPAMDKEAHDDFQRRCETLVTVSDKKFLPVKPLVKFCETTDAPMECRLKVSMRLKETHARDGDMGQFCTAVYDWFQGKYGMKCPKQCRKLQCRSTCLWLEKKKEANEENLDIKDEMSEAEEKMKYLKELAKNISSKEAEEKKGKFTVSMSDTRVGRAQKALDARDKEHKAGVAKLDKVDKTVADIKKNITILKNGLIQAEDAVTKKGFELDKAQLKMEDMGRTAKRLLDKAEEAEKEEKSQKENAEGIEEELDKLKKERDRLSKTIDEDKKSSAGLKKDLDEKVKKLQKAQDDMKPFRVDTSEEITGKDWVEIGQKYIHGNYNDDKRVPETKELVQNQYMRAVEAQSAYRSMEQKIKNLGEMVKNIDRQVTQYKEEHKKVKASKDKAKAAAKKLIDDSKKQESQIKDFKEKTVDKGTKELAAMSDAKNEAEKQLKTANTTLKFTEDLQKQQESHVHALESYVSQAQMSLQNEKDAKKTAEEQLTKLTEELKILTAEEKEKKTEMESMESGMMGRIKAYKERAKKLFLNRPEIVRLHGLEPKM